MKQVTKNIEESWRLSKYYVKDKPAASVQEFNAGIDRLVKALSTGILAIVDRKHGNTILKETFCEVWNKTCIDESRDGLEYCPRLEEMLWRKIKYDMKNEASEDI